MDKQRRSLDDFLQKHSDLVPSAESRHTPPPKAKPQATPEPVATVAYSFRAAPGLEVLIAELDFMLRRLKLKMTHGSKYQTGLRLIQKLVPLIDAGEIVQYPSTAPLLEEKMDEIIAAYLEKKSREGQET